MNLYHVTRFFPYFSFTVYCFYTKISSFMPVLSTRIVLDCFYLLIFYSEKFSTDVCRLPCAVNVNLNLSIISWGRREMSAVFSGYTARPATQFRNFFPYARRQASGASSPLLRPKGGGYLLLPISVKISESICTYLLILLVVSNLACRSE